MGESESDKADYHSVKYLLRQVYAAHTLRIKECEAEISLLREKLEESDREKQSAYAACQEYKNAVLEQKKKMSELEKIFSSVDSKQCVTDDISKQSTANGKNSIEKQKVVHPVVEELKHSSDSLTFDTQNFLLQSSQLDYQLRTSTQMPQIQSQPEPSSKALISTTLSPIKKTLSRGKHVRKSHKLNSDDEIFVPETADLLPSSKSNSPKKSSPKKLSQEKENSAKRKKQAGNVSLSKKRTLGEVAANEVSANNKRSKLAPDTPTKENLVDSDIIPNSPECYTICQIGPSQPNLKEFKDSFSDFQNDTFAKPSSSAVSAKDKNADLSSKNDGTWKSSIRKKVPTKLPKVIKSNSKYQLTLEAPDKNSKKINYKQTKLSKSSFMPNKASDKAIDNTDKTSESELVKKPIAVAVESQDNLVSMSELICITDFDNSCIPTTVQELSKTGNFQSQPSATLCPLELIAKQKPNNLKKKEPSSKIILIDDDSDDEIEPPPKLDDSFDKLPVANKKDEPNYKYKEDAVRGKNKRKQLNAFDCKECEKYYSNLGISEEEKKERMKNCSRHRCKYAPPATPDHFWELDFPDTQECKARGYLNETQKVQLKSRRRRPLAND